ALGQVKLPVAQEMVATLRAQGFDVGIEPGPGIPLTAKPPSAEKRP
ncbi:MAG: hypothetical protein HY901_31095, partial [Deltaproteobacteria bacterium]|nr:hypothetical protein [Deltaproteobacteria bacterium]